MPTLYPRIPKITASQLTHERVAMPVIKLKELDEPVIPDYVVGYTPTGGRRVTEDALKALRLKLREAAEVHGYPYNYPDQSGAVAYDLEVSIILYENMDLSPSEASYLDIWLYIACVLAPDIVRWRFPGPDKKKTSKDRFLAQRRNMFRRLWWRAHLLSDSHWDDPYYLLAELGEDDLVQLTERPTLAGSPQLSKLITTLYLDYLQQIDDIETEITDRLLWRESLKRFSRLFSITMLYGLEEDTIRNVVTNVFEKTRISLENQM